MIDGWSTGAIAASVPGLVVLAILLGWLIRAGIKQVPTVMAIYAVALVILVPNALMGRI